jgi:hypothetical protein
MLILCQSVGPDVSDLTELDLPPTMKTDFPDPANLLHFKIILNPDEGASSVSSGRALASRDRDRALRCVDLTII